MANQERKRASERDLSSDLELAHLIADQADKITMDRFQAIDLKVESKADMTLVSDADRATEHRIRELLDNRRPLDSIVGEEEQELRREGQYRWVIDPIDGTHNFVRAVPVWATLIALLDESGPVLGLVSAPALGRRWWAHQGSGAYVRDLTGESSEARRPRKIGVSAVDSLSDAFFSYASIEGWTAAGRESQLMDLIRSCWRTRAFGDFWSYMMVAEGTVDCAAEPQLELYDMAALVPIVIEAGGQFTSIDGQPGPWGPGAIATNGALHRQTLDALASR